MKNHNRRRQYLVDRKFQLGVMARLIAALTFAFAFYVGLVYIVPDSNQLDGMSGTAARSLILRLCFAFFVVSLLSLALVAVVLTHRITGPAMVLRRAVAGMREGDFTRRLKLREKDYLKELADELLALQTQLKAAQAAEKKEPDHATV